MTDKTGRRGRKSRRTKDRVLQARIPEQLDDELRDRAEQLGLSVSTIVRNVLLHTFDLVEGVVTDSSQIARALTGREAASPTSEAALPAPPAVEPATATSVIGWQEAILNKNGVCEECNAILPMGERAAIGVPSGPRAVLLCRGCLGALISPAEESAVTPPAPQRKKKASSAKAPAGSKKAAD
jgi:hypothetical protein